MAATVPLADYLSPGLESVNGPSVPHLIGWGAPDAFSLPRPFAFPTGPLIPLTTRSVAQTIRRIWAFAAEAGFTVSSQHPPLFNPEHKWLLQTRSSGCVLAEAAINVLPAPGLLHLEPQRYTSSVLWASVALAAEPPLPPGATAETVVPHAVAVGGARATSALRAGKGRSWRTFERVDPDPALQALAVQLGESLRALA